MALMAHPKVASAIGVVLIVAAGCSTIGGEPRTAIAQGLQPRLSAADAVSITRKYLDAQTPKIADPAQHVPPRINAVWAVAADEAQAIDGCIQPQTSTQIVWITKGVGDYLNLQDWPWSHSTAQTDANTVEALTCGGPGPAGTVVIDDATGSILGVYPEAPPYLHATGAPTP